jgi:hypothetical protein
MVTPCLAAEFFRSLLEKELSSFQKNVLFEKGGWQFRKS